MIERKWNIPNYPWSQFMKHVNVTADTTVILHTGRGGILPAGRYEVAELDGTEGRLFLIGPGGDLVQADPNDPDIADVIDYETLDYTHDRRVQAQPDGTVLVTSGVLYWNTDRLLSQDGDWWYARGAFNTDCDVHDEGDRYNTRLRPFGSAEEAACFIVGGPSELVEENGEYRMFLLTLENGTAYVNDKTGEPDTLLIQHSPEQPAETAWFAFEEHAAEPYIFYGPTPEAAADAYFGIE